MTRPSTAITSPVIAALVLVSQGGGAGALGARGLPTSGSYGI